MKAKYIADKEKSLLNDLIKAGSKLKELANYYHLTSDYKLTAEDLQQTQKYVDAIGEIYAQLGSFLFNTRQFDLLDELGKSFEKEQEDVTKD